MLAIPALVLLGAPTLAAADDVGDPAANGASVETETVDPSASDPAQDPQAAPPTPSDPTLPGEEAVPPADETVPPAAPSEASADQPDTPVPPETDASDAPDPQAPATAPEAAEPPAPVDCMAIPIGNDDRSARDACLASQQTAARSFAPLAATWPYDPVTPNPALQPVCGIDIALVLDTSGSIGSGGMADLKDAADAFTGSLVDTGSQISVAAFNTDASVLLGATDLTSANLGTVQGSYSGLSSDGWTNWKRGLELARGTYGGFDSPPVELTIVITDGNPNTVDPGDGGEFPDGDPGAVNPAIAQANAMKSAGSHVFVVAVGDDVDLLPIEAISGGAAFDGSNFGSADYVQSTDYSTLAASLKSIATALCGGSVVIEKQIAHEPAEGWTFSSADANVAPASQATGADGKTAPFKVTGFGDTDTRTIGFAEEDRAGYQLGSVSCEVDGKDRPITADGALGWKVDVGKFEIVRCLVVNVEDAAKWRVTKSSSPATAVPVERGDAIDYSLKIEHLSGAAATNIEILDDISQLAPYVEFDGFVGTQPADFSWNDLDPGRLWLKVASLGKGQTLTLTYRVTVAADAPPGVVLRNHVLTNCPAPSTEPPIVGIAAPSVDPCVTEHPTPAWTLRKWADPASGSLVYPGQQVTYTLQAYNSSQAPVTDASATDDLSDVLDDATLDEPLAPGLEFDEATGQLSWAIPDLDPGEWATVSYTVTVDEDAWGAMLHNVATPDDTVGSCPTDVVLEAGDAILPDSCETDHDVAEPDLRIAKSWSHDEGENPVDSGSTPPDVISYTLSVWNDGDPVADPVVTDALPEGVAFVEGSESLPAGWSFDGETDGVLTFSYGGLFGPLAEAEAVQISFDVEVGELAQPDPTVPIPDLVNTACVAGEIPVPPDAEVEILTASPAAAEKPDADGPLADCAEASTPVKSIALDGFAQCVNDAPWFDYSITPVNVDALPAVALIWWTPSAFAGRDPSIPASDEAAILADGASRVDYVAVPPGWMPGDAITGAQLWPGAVLDSAGNPIDWPGWTLLPNGTWVLDPAAPFYDLRNEAVVEVRINPSTDQVTAYPPATPDCNAAPTNTPPKPGMASTGFDQGWLGPLAVGMLAVGALGVWFVSRRQRRDDAG